ncbi:flavanone 3-dioxygenase 3 [Salvia hispanica]|uniref:flavanone 3-dioxygenase 3 n=1 Tax=Salvia hispanica TaxID=49212 RepID=UPI00200946AC|nr:flavanone 3-dioxygenase 3 [Salvia hispanica]
MTLAQMGVSSVPECYILPPAERPTLEQTPPSTFSALPVIDLSSLENPVLRPHVIEQVHMACKEFGGFQVINHGIPVSLTDQALDVAADFFDMPNDTKMQFASTNVHEPVRYGTSLNQVNDKIQYWRDFIKHYANPISTWIDLWPSEPPSYKEKMGNYAKALLLLHTKLIQIVFESLGLQSDYLQNDVEQGSQVIAVNCYPTCPQPNLALGLPRHSDYGLLTIILQDQQGLEVMDRNENWQPVPLIEGALVVQVGDQMEVLSNGRYKSIVHRATVNLEKKRLSIASLHSLAINRKVTPAPDLVDERHPLSYKEGSFEDFLNFLSDNDILEGRYIDTLRKNSDSISEAK